MLRAALASVAQPASPQAEGAAVCDGSQPAPSPAEGAAVADGSEGDDDDESGSVQGAMRSGSDIDSDSGTSTPASPPPPSPPPASDAGSDDDPLPQARRNIKYCSACGTAWGGITLANFRMHLESNRACSAKTGTDMNALPANWQSYACFEAPDTQQPIAQDGPSHFKCECGVLISFRSPPHAIRFHRESAAHINKLAHMPPPPPPPSGRIDHFFAMKDAAVAAAGQDPDHRDDHGPDGGHIDHRAAEHGAEGEQSDDDTGAAGSDGVHSDDGGAQGEQSDADSGAAGSQGNPPIVQHTPKCPAVLPIGCTSLHKFRMNYPHFVDVLLLERNFYSAEMLSGAHHMRCTGLAEWDGLVCLHPVACAMLPMF